MLKNTHINTKQSANRLVGQGGGGGQETELWVEGGGARIPNVIGYICFDDKRISKVFDRDGLARVIKLVDKNGPPVFKNTIHIYQNNDTPSRPNYNNNTTTTTTTTTNNNNNNNKQIECLL